ncbi:hypothetical protein EPI10_011470 [Gossypium australe]|uniref:Retrotransposon gag domain-containing protein n=1 Tax=Gossypium australe TaxID=47621 RepID=A0A5B6W7D6_9ROSI|nr:hypothetical protein EPI10_011470 [Gossypium australe]
MMDKMMESQRNMMTQMTQMKRLLNGLMDKGKSPMVNVEENTEYPQHPPSFTAPHVQTRPERPSVMIRPQQFQAGASVNLQTGSGSRDNPIITNVPDLDEIAEGEKTKVELPKQLEDRCKWLDEKLKAIESVDNCYGIDAKDLSLHSLVGAAAKWYNQLSRTRIGSWRDLAQASIKQYNHMTNIAPDRITLQNMEKKTNDSFRQYAQRWRELATQVQPPLLEKEMTMFFISTLKAPFINHMLGSATKSFSDIVMSGEMIENAIRCGKIEAREGTKRSTLRRRENDVNNTSTYNKGHSRAITMSQPKAVTTNHQGPPRFLSTRVNNERIQFTPIPMTYRELYQNLFDAHVVAPFYLTPLQPPFPKWYNANTQCEYHARIVGHSIENCTAFKKVVEKLIKMGIVKFDDLPVPNVAGNPLPNHTDQGVNGIDKDRGRKIKHEVAEVKTLLTQVWKEMVKKGLIISDSEERSEGKRNHCEFHNREGHGIQECT